MSEYESGTVAVATVRGVPNVRITRTASRRDLWFSAEHHGPYRDGVGSIQWHEGSDVTDIRPLVVLDPEDREHVERLAAACRAAFGWTSGPVDGDIDATQTALRSLATPPKPAEPQGDGAVVEDVNGHRWVRIAGPEPDRESKPWRHRGHAARTWDHVNAVRVLSEGIQP